MKRFSSKLGFEFWDVTTSWTLRFVRSHRCQDFTHNFQNIILSFLSLSYFSVLFNNQTEYKKHLITDTVCVSLWTVCEYSCVCIPVSYVQWRCPCWSVQALRSRMRCLCGRRGWAWVRHSAEMIRCLYERSGEPPPSLLVVLQTFSVCTAPTHKKELNQRRGVREEECRTVNVKYKKIK